MATIKVLVIKVIPKKSLKPTGSIVDSIPKSELPSGDQWPAG
jgi:hypothetical protein